MNYKEARDYIRRASERGSVLGLDNIRRLLGELLNPQDSLKFIHIAGTNGKGSVLAFLSSVLKEAGYHTGSYISPSVRGYRERIQVDGNWISEEAFAKVVETCADAVSRMEEKGLQAPTVFEIETAAAMLFFCKENCDIVVMETGLGGLLDATNVINSTVAAVFTSVSRDHMGFLGNTLREIAVNKAGIMKPGCVAVTGPQQPEVLEVFRECAANKGCLLKEAVIKDILVSEESFEGQTYQLGLSWTVLGMPREIKVSLGGSYQIENVAAALQAIEALKEKGFAISEEQIARGFSKARWDGRFTCVWKNPVFIVDGAHNPAAALRLRETVERYFKGRRLLFLMGMFKDKEYEEITRIMAPMAERIYTVSLPDKERTLPAEELKRTASQYCSRVTAVSGTEQAVEMALAKAGPQDVIIAFGSLSYLGEILDYFKA